MTFFDSLTQHAYGALLLCVVAAMLATACGGTDAEDSTSAEASTTAPAAATPLERLIVAYGDERLDPSAAAWERLLAEEGFATQQVAVVEFVRLKSDDGARAGYDEFVDAFTLAVNDAGGEMFSVNDTLMPGLEGLEGYENGVSWLAKFPTISAYVDAMLDERAVAAAQSRRDSIDEAQVLAGPNLLPDVILELPPNAPASDFPRDRVIGVSAEQVVDDLLAVYPSGGADPTRNTLEAIMAYEGLLDQRVHFINLYRFNDAPGGGAAALGEYNAAAFPHVVAHGGRPKVLVDVTHHLVGPVAWDRFIFVSWASLGTFTTLRLDESYIEAQKDRVMSAEQYGNLITIARQDRPAE